MPKRSLDSQMAEAKIRTSIPAYEGDDPYVFISYARKDTARVMPFLERLKQNQYRFWYDQGIDRDARFWSAVIGEHLVNASFVLLFMSANAIASDNGFKEISLADEDKKPMIIVFLEETSLSPRWRLLLSGAQRMDYHKYADLEQFLPKLFMSRQFANVRGKAGSDLASMIMPSAKVVVDALVNAIDNMKFALKSGDQLTFGNYQGEAIQWRVLVVESGRALIFSRKILDAKPYNITLNDATWETSTLRAWLNNSFYHSAFTEAERERISETFVLNSDNPAFETAGGRNTKDRVFLLSLDEAGNYLSSDGVHKAFPTAYAKLRGAQATEIGTGWWWLRSPGSQSNLATLVSFTGFVIDYGFRVDNEGGGVRPALWLSL